MSMESSISMITKSTWYRTTNTCNARTWIRSGATQMCAVSIAKLASTWTETTDFLTETLEKGKTLVHQLSQVCTLFLSQRLERWETWFLSWCPSSNLCTTSTPMVTFGPFPTVRLRKISWRKLIPCKSRFSMRYLLKRQNPRVSKQEELLTCSATQLPATALTGSWLPQVFLQCLQSSAQPTRTLKFSAWKISHWLWMLWTNTTHWSKRQSKNFNPRCKLFQRVTCISGKRKRKLIFQSTLSTRASKTILITPYSRSKPNPNWNLRTSK